MNPIKISPNTHRNPITYNVICEGLTESRFNVELPNLGKVVRDFSNKVDAIQGSKYENEVNDTRRAH